MLCISYALKYLRGGGGRSPKPVCWSLWFSASYLFEKNKYPYHDMHNTVAFCLILRRLKNIYLKNLKVFKPCLPI